MARRHAPIAAAPVQKKIVPAFTVQKLDGEYEVQMARMIPTKGPTGEILKDKNGNAKHRLEFFMEKRPMGWLVTMPAKYSHIPHSIHIATIEEMEAEGFTNTEIPLVNEDGEPVGSIPNQVRRAKAGVSTNA